MKRGTIRHPKLLRVARQLGCKPYAAIGLLEALLDWAYSFARRGDVGRFSDEDIAEAVGWDGNAHDFIAALVETRWLDRCLTHRLVIHDLAEHADRTWRQALDRAGEQFAVVHPPPPDAPREATLSTQCVLSEDSLSTPARPGQAKPDLDLSFASLTQGAEPPRRATELGFDRFWTTYPKKRHKPAAVRAWKGVDGARHLEAIVAGVERWTTSEPWERGFIEDPSTFLRQRQWEDEPPASRDDLETAHNLREIKRGLDMVGRAKGWNP